MAFRSTSVVPNGAAYQLIGNLTIGSVTRAILLDVEFDGTAHSADQRLHAGFRAAGVIRRRDFGIDIGLGPFDFLVGDKVDIAVHVVFTAAEAEGRPTAA
jgi:polyisoprenoid-binding protein YceI